MTVAAAGVRRARHRPTEIEYMPFDGFGRGLNGLDVLDWINDNGGDAYEKNGHIYIKNSDREDSRNFIKPGVDRVARRLRWPSGEPTSDFYRLEPQVWADAYDDLGEQP